MVINLRSEHENPVRNGAEVPVQKEVAEVLPKRVRKRASPVSKPPAPVHPRRRRSRKSATDAGLLVGRRLSAALAYSRLSAEEVAALAGITRQTLWRYEAGKAKPDLLTMSDIAKILEVRLDWLATGEGVMLLAPETNGDHGTETG